MGREVEVKAAGAQVGGGAAVGFGSEGILQRPDGGGEVREAERGVALGAVGGEVYHDEIELGGQALPLDEEEVLPGGVFGPGGARGEQVEGALPYGAGGEGRKESLVDGLDGGVGRFGEAAEELDGGVAAGAGELTIVEEAEAGQGENGQRGGAVLGRGEERGDAWLIMVFEEMGGGGERARGRAEEMALDGRGVARDEAIVEGFVVGKVEAEVLEAGFEAPIDFGEEEEAGVDAADGSEGGVPELVRRLRSEGREVGPGAGEDVVEEKHGHIATDAIAEAGNVQELVEHGAASFGPAIIELGGVAPGGKIRVFAVGEPPRAEGGLLEERAGDAAGALDEEVGAVAEPGVVEPDMVGDEIEQQFKAIGLEAAAELLEAVHPAKGGRHLVGGDGVRRGADIGVLPAGQSVGVSAALALGAERVSAGARAAGPDAHEPDVSEPGGTPAVEFGLGDVGERDGAAGAVGELAQPAAGVQLVGDGGVESGRLRVGGGAGAWSVGRDACDRHAGTEAEGVAVQRRRFNTLSALAGSETRIIIRPRCASDGVAL